MPTERPDPSVLAALMTDEDRTELERVRVQLLDIFRSVQSTAGLWAEVASKMEPKTHPLMTHVSVAATYLQVAATDMGTLFMTLMRQGARLNARHLAAEAALSNNPPTPQEPLTEANP